MVEERCQGCRVLTLYGRTHLELSCFVGERLQTFIASPGPLSQHHTPSLHFLFGEELVLAPQSGTDSGRNQDLSLAFSYMTCIQKSATGGFWTKCVHRKRRVGCFDSNESINDHPLLSFSNPHAPHSPEAAVTQCSLHFHLEWKHCWGICGHYWQSRRDFLI